MGHQTTSNKEAAKDKFNLHLTRIEKSQSVSKDNRPMVITPIARSPSRLNS